MTTTFDSNAAIERLGEFNLAFQKESDRGCAVLVMAVLEEVVISGLKHVLGPFAEEMVRVVAPHGQWRTLSKSAEAFGLVSANERADLERLVQVRNIFAHRAMEGLSFDHEHVRDQLQHLVLYPLMFPQSSGPNNRASFLMTASVLYAIIAGRIPEIKPLDRCPDLSWPSSGLRNSNGTKA